MIFLEKKLKEMENENVPKQFKTNHNILKTLSYIENTNITNQWKLHVSMVICFRVTTKTKIPNIIQGDSLSVKHSLSQKVLMFLKMFFLHSFKVLKKQRFH